jgi:hypothetical protein
MLFPWDHAGDAGASSSVTGIALGSADPGGDKVNFDHVEVRMRGSSASARSRRASSILPSHVGSLGASPGALGQDLQFTGEDFAFDGETVLQFGTARWAHFDLVPANDSAAPESHFNLVNLERNSFNFLE